MISFKTFLQEASAGPDKWDKYFSGSDIQTITKKETALFDLNGKKTDELIPKGAYITVLGALEPEYTSKPKIVYGEKKYRVSLTDIAKPIILNKTVKINLKPDVLGITGDFDMLTFAEDVKKIIDEHTEVPAAQGEYLKALVDHASRPDEADAKDAVIELFTSSGIKTDMSLKNTINTDFMEILGPFFVSNEFDEYYSGTCSFPTAGNEPLYDFIMKDEDGIELMCSSKKSTGSVNTLKVKPLVQACEDYPELARKYKREFELLNLINNTKIKETPNALNDWLTKTFDDYTPAKPAITSPEMYRLEADTIKWINSSNLDFTEIVDAAIPELMYVKAKLATDGTLVVDPLRKGADHTKLKFRSKNSSNRMIDKIGLVV